MPFGGRGEAVKVILYNQLYDSQKNKNPDSPFTGSARVHTTESGINKSGSNPLGTIDFMLLNFTVHEIDFFVTHHLVFPFFEIFSPSQSIISHYILHTVALTPK